MRLTNLRTPFTFQQLVTTSGTPEQLGVKLRAATVAFNDNSPSADTITDSGSGFLIAGFQENDTITISGSASNDGTYTIASVTAGTITLTSADALTTEGASATVTVTAPKTLPDGISVTIKALNANTGTIHIADSSQKAVNSTTGNFSIQNNESVAVQVNSTDRVWIDSSVSGEGVEIIFEKQ